MADVVANPLKLVSYMLYGQAVAVGQVFKECLSIKDGLKMLEHSVDLGLSNSKVVTGVDMSEGWEWSGRDATLKGD